MNLVRLGRQVDEPPEAGLALRPAGQAELTADGRAVVLQVDRDRHPRPDAGVPAEQEAGLHRRGLRRRGGGSQRPERDDEKAEDGRDTDGAAGAPGDVRHEWVTAHGTPR